MTERRGLYVYWKLFWTNFILSACTFGGGFVIITMMKRKFVEQLQWIEETEMLDMAAVAQSAPGSLAVNMAIIVGFRIRKIGGALASVLGTVLPPLIIISVISLCYNQFKDNSYVALFLQVMRAGVAAVIFDVVISLAKNVFKTGKWIWVVLMFVSFIASYIFKVSAVTVIAVCAVIGLLHIRFGKPDVSTPGCDK